LTALLNPNDQYHSWARDTTRRLPLPLITREPVLAEVFHLLGRDGYDGDEVFALAESGVLTIGLRLEDEQAGGILALEPEVSNVVDSAVKARLCTRDAKSPGRPGLHAQLERGAVHR
jgi:hypothetical protein